MLGNSGTALGLPEDFFPTRYETLRRWLRRRIDAERALDHDRTNGTDSPFARLDVQRLLVSICDYAIERQDTSKTGSAFLLRVFWAYTRSEIATLARSSAPVVHDWLQVANREWQEYVTQPPRPHHRLPDWCPRVGSSGNWLSDLCSALARTRQAPCPPAEWYRALYDCGDEPDCQTLAHLAKCGPCQQFVTTHLGVRARGRGHDLLEPAEDETGFTLGGTVDDSGLSVHPLVTSDTRDPRRAIRELVEQHFRAHWQRVYRYLRCTQCDAVDAEEITQEAFLRLHRVLVAGEHIRDVPRWIFTVARHLASDRRRRYERPLLVELSRNLADTLPDDGASCEEELYERQRHAALTRALNDLTQLQRECLHLRAEGYSLREISARVGVSVCGVSDAVGRAVRRLRKHLNGSD